MEGGGLAHRATGDVAHSVKPVRLQLPAVSLSHPPKVGDRTVIPQKLAVLSLVKICDSHPVLVGVGVFCHDIHSYLAKIKIRANSRGSRNSCFTQHVLYYHSNEIVRTHFTCFYIIGDIYKDLVDRVDVYIVL